MIDGLISFDHSISPLTSYFVIRTILSTLITITQQALGVTAMEMCGQRTLNVCLESRPHIRFHKVEKFLVRDAETMPSICDDINV